MADLNKVFLIGRLTFDPELRWTPGGAAVADLRLATTRTWSGKDGERGESTLYIDVTVWNRQAENCCQYLKKGRSVHVEGYLKMDSWDDKTTGEKKSKIKVEAERVQFLDGKSDAGGPPADADHAPPPARERESAPPRRGGSDDFRGSNSGNGASRGNYQNQIPGNPPARRPAPPAGPDGEDEDIPF